jgi:hypothetical protein
LHRDVARDLGETRHRLKTLSRPHLVVAADAIVTCPLDVAGDQVLAVVLQAAIGEEQVSDVADRHQIVGLSNAVGVGLEDGADISGDAAGERINDSARVEDVRSTLLQAHPDSGTRQRAIFEKYCGEAGFARDRMTLAVRIIIAARRPGSPLLRIQERPPSLR